MIRHIGVLAAALLGAACGRQEAAESPMAGMTAEEHARMQSGGAQQVDSSGQLVRQMVHLSPAEERALGVVYATVGRETLSKSVRTVGEIQPAESRVAEVTPKVEGFVERLFVNTTGETVRRGQPLLSLYSPMLVAAQEEFLTARRLVGRVDSSAREAWQGARATLDAARRRLAYWDITDEQVARLERTGEVTKTLTLVSPVSGVVLEKDVFEGRRVMPGERLYQLADLSEVWVEGEVFEQDLRLIRRGAQAHIEVAAYPGEHTMGQVSFVHPTVDVESRTNRVRVTVANRDLRLKPGMFATIYFDAVVGQDVIAVPMAAVIVTGERNVVFVRDSAGMLGPRDVVLGLRAGDRVQVLTGLAAGETIVASANFLIDAESRLGGTGASMPGMQHSAVEPGRPAPAAPPPPPEHRHD
ncbi:MAG: efflux RND transporter periplasmic adaptor subunit [Gemmatimonadales bacterium]